MENRDPIIECLNALEKLVIANGDNISRLTSINRGLHKRVCRLEGTQPKVKRQSIIGFIKRVKHAITWRVNRWKRNRKGHVL